MITFLVPSLDRPSQLDCLLRSIQKHWAGKEYNVKVLYKGSNIDYLKGYLKVAELHPNILALSPEYNFCEDWKRLLNYSENNVQLITDDTVYFNTPPADWSKYFEDNVHCISFRLSPKTIIQDYLTGQVQPPIDIYESASMKKETDSMIKWHYKRHPKNNNFGYQFSLDACNYRKSDLIKYTVYLNFESPRALEWQLNNKVDRNSLPNYMVCPNNQCAVVNTINNIQPNGPPAGQKYFYSVKYLNDCFLSGQRISLRSFNDLIGNVVSCHEEYPLVFEEIK